MGSDAGERTRRELNNKTGVVGGESRGAARVSGERRGWIGAGRRNMTNCQHDGSLLLMLNYQYTLDNVIKLIMSNLIMKD